MKITAIKQQKRRKDRINLYIDGEFKLSIAAEIAVRSGLRTGHEIDQVRLTELAEDDARWRAREAALHLLSFRQRSEREIRERLLAKGFSPSAVDQCVASLHDSGLLDDEAFALAFIRDRQRSRPSGRARLLAELRRKGVDPEAAAGLLDDLLAEGETELDLARRAIRKFPARRGEDPLRERRRLYAYLGRRGFSGDTIRNVLAESDDHGI